MDREQFETASSVLRDKQSLIAAGKVQRWEVVKWSVTVNVALATASTFVGARWAIVLICFAVAALGVFLLHHYNQRMTGARRMAKNVIDKLRENNIDVDSWGGEPPYQTELESYDKDELRLFVWIVCGSVVPAILVSLYPK